jgi:hypothetical protein
MEPDGSLLRSLSWTRSAQSMSPFPLLEHPFSYSPLIMHMSSKWLFPQVSPLKPCMHVPLSRTCYMPAQSLFKLDHPNNIWLAVQITKLLVMQCSPHPCYLVPFRPKLRILTVKHYKKWVNWIVLNASWVCISVSEKHLQLVLKAIHVPYVFCDLTRFLHGS